MTKRELAAFVLKLLGVYAIIQSLPMLIYLSSLLEAFLRDSSGMPDRVWMRIGMSAPFFLTAVAAFVMGAWRTGLSAAVQVGLAIVLFLRARGLAILTISVTGRVVVGGHLRGHAHHAVVLSCPPPHVIIRPVHGPPHRADHRMGGHQHPRSGRIHR